MTPDYSRIWPWIFAVLIPLMVYRRLRRSFGRHAYFTARGGAMRTGALLFVGLGRRETVGVEDVLKGDDTFQLVDVGAADHGQQIQLR